MLGPNPKIQRAPKSKIQIYPNPVEKSRKHFMKQVATENPFRVYLTAIERELQQGIASEHTHQPALKAFIETVCTSTIATNEPKRIKCGAPDFIVTNEEAHPIYIQLGELSLFPPRKAHTSLLS
jgi:hypothetical protein